VDLDVERVRNDVRCAPYARYLERAIAELG
jgi:hypothetical protein